MGKDKGDKSKKDHAINQDSVALQSLTTATHVCIVLFVVFILYLALRGEYSVFNTIFAWHPILLTIGFMFFMSQGILALNPLNSFMSNLQKDTKLFYHWLFQVFCAILIAIGGTIGYTFLDANREGKHFLSWHAWFGLAGFAFTFLSCLNGTGAFWSNEIRKFIAPKKIKAAHVIAGTSAFAFGGLALLTSLWTHWFEVQSGASETLFLFGLLVTAGALGGALLKPIKSCIRKWPNLKSN